MLSISPLASLTLRRAPKFTFSQVQPFNTMTNPVLRRVMSTPTWPMPYYQRTLKAYPIREAKPINLLHQGVDATDYNWFSAKEILSSTLQGRAIVDYTEKNIKTKSYLIRKDDCESMVRAYVADISQFLSIANKENVRILKGKTLI